MAQEETPYESISPLLLGADNHNIGNSGFSIFSPSTYAEGVSNVVKFSAASVLSGANSVYNTGITVGNWFGADAKIRATDSWITSLDSDTGKYYSEHRESADLAGFIATGFLPGMGGIKLLQAGQAALRAPLATGLIGKNMSKYTGLLTNGTDAYVQLARGDIAASQATFNAINAKTTLALVSGFTQGVLEAGAFEIFATLPQVKSPTLSNMDSVDVMKNILVGGALGGVIGGVFTGASTVWKLGKARTEADLVYRTQNTRELVQEATAPSDRILLAEHAKNSTADINSALPPLSSTASNAERQVYEMTLGNLTNTKNALDRRVANYQRENVHELVFDFKDPVFGNRIADSLIGSGEEQLIKNLAGATSFSRVGSVIPTAAKNTELVGAKYIKLGGNDVGTVLDELPKYMKLADRVSVTGNQTLEDAVRTSVKNEKFNHSELFNPLENIITPTGWQRNEARVIWAAEQTLSRDVSVTTLVHQNDVALLGAYLDQGILPNVARFNYKNGDYTYAGNFTPPTGAALRDLIITQKESLYLQMLALRTSKNGKDLLSKEHINSETIARSLDVDRAYLEGVENAINPEAALFATKASNAAYKELQTSLGREGASIDKPAYFIPDVAKITYDSSKLAQFDGFVSDAISFIQARQKNIQQDVERILVTQIPKEIYSRMGTINDQYLLAANSAGASGGLFTSANVVAGYSPTKMLASEMQRLGGVTQDLVKYKREYVLSKMESALFNVKNSQAASIEASSINQYLSRTTERYIRDVDDLAGLGSDVWIPKKWVDAFVKSDGTLEFAEVAGSLPLQVSAKEFIKPNNPEVIALLKSHSEVTAYHGGETKARWSVLGKNDSRNSDSNVLYPWRDNPKDFSYFAFVKDNRVTGAGHTTMLTAASDEQLELLVRKVNTDFPEFTVYFKKETAEFKKANREFDYDRSLNENYINSALNSKGIFSDTFTKTDPDKIVNSILDYHYRTSDMGAREIVRTKYNDIFNWLEDQAGVYSKFESSKFKGASLETIEQTEKNPYISYVKTALGFSSQPANGLWQSANKSLDDAVSKVVGRVRQVFDEGKVTQEKLAEINTLLAESGYNTAIKNSAELALINHTAPKYELSKFVNSANAIMSRFTLGLDPLNALNNAIGSNVLRGTELSQLTRAIRDGNTDIAGALGAVAQLNIPGVKSLVTSPTKLFGNAIEAMWKDFRTEGKPLLNEFKSQGFIRDRLEQFSMMADDLALAGTETVGQLESKVSLALNKAEKLSGNPLAEEFNRFVSAHVMKQITDIGVANKIFSPQEALTYINTFVNRVEGSIIASQRPGLFQGPVGQAIGLFQSYQFNLLQNLFRYVAEGTGKDTAMLLGLQGTLYGLNGEPGFKFINEHIVGTASGNIEHRDIYDATRGIVGKDAGNWLLYGAASNLLQTNIYSRGDINPRHLTIVPTAIADIPFIGGLTKVFSSLFETSSKISNGGAVWESIRQGIEHNGVYRPLQGLAQVAGAFQNDGKPFSTSSKGTIIGSNDLYSLATLSRLAGGRPLDEAILNDTMFSIHSYETVDKKRKNALAEVVKTTVIGANRNPSEDQVASFAQKYAELGGKQGSFNKYMLDQYAKANVPESQKLFEKLNNPLVYKIQGLMGGDL